VNRTVETMIQAIREMRPRLDSRAREVEAARRVPADILAELRRLGVFRMNVPRSHGGLQLPLPQSCEVVAELIAGTTFELIDEPVRPRADGWSQLGDQAEGERPRQRGSPPPADGPPRQSCQERIYSPYSAVGLARGAWMTPSNPVAAGQLARTQHHQAQHVEMIGWIRR
jgi:hypothetical protein